MRILVGLHASNFGSALIAGFDIFEKSLEARKRIGYLPENTPLYQDMRVNEYLRYRANLKRVPGRKVSERVGDVIELCNLGMKERAIIGTLSKGQRQRVGLADALVHDPDLLILDEPTIGLDPNQIRQVRELIKNLANKRTVLISTHILPEVEIMCSRVIVIHQGENPCQRHRGEPVSNYRAAGNMRMEARTHGGDARRTACNNFRGSRMSQQRQDGDFTIFNFRLEAGADPAEDAMRLAVARQWSVRELTRRRATLEDVFVELTHSDRLDSSHTPDI